MSDSQPHKSRTARSYDELREAIVDAHYPPGERLKIDQICRDLKVSTGAAREALSRLTSEGFVIAEPQKGFVVAPISRRDLLQLTEVRIDVEARCLSDSIKYGDLIWEGRVLSVGHRLNSLGDVYKKVGTPEAKQWHQWHQEFHDQLASACNNAWWLRMRHQLYIQSERYRRMSGAADESDRDITSEHKQIADAALSRDSDRATAKLREHLSRTTEILLASKLPFADD